MSGRAAAPGRLPFTQLSRPCGRVSAPDKKTMIESLLYFRRAAKQDDAAHADFALLKGALHQLMAKWPPHVRRRHFPVASKVQSTLRLQMRLPVPVRISPHLLSDLCHEIAEYVDASVRQAAVRCMRRCAVAGSVTADA